ncbi:MAG: polyhydroxyalkanoic acid system family protein [Deltaproteobacteria bacterium]|nr:polyhydroxyalkanoic acid system family protein [Deltaproteobacteria bacterium]
MADIKVTKNHSLGVTGARERLNKLAEELQKNYGIKSGWNGNVATLSGTGLKQGTVSVGDATVTVEITLGMLAKAMKGKIEEQINIAFDKALS